MTYYINTVSIDYLSLTTYSHFDFLSVANQLEREYDGGLVQARRMQYNGLEYKTDSGSFFMGIGMINEREHHMIQASGMLSHRVAEICHEWGFSTMSKPDQWSCKRIDIQLTIRHENLDAHELRKRIRGAEWPKGIARKLTVISSETDTLYIGSRSSAVMFRIYQKDDEHVRLELEMKKDVAKRCWEWFIRECKDSESMNRTAVDILSFEVRNIPNVEYLRKYRKALASKNRIDVSTGERAKGDDSKKYKWFVSLIPTLERMANDSDYGWKVRAVFKGIIDKSDTSE